MLFEILISVALATFAYLAYRWPSYAFVVLSSLLPIYLLRFSILGIPTNAFEASVLIFGTVCFLVPSSRDYLFKTLRSLPVIFLVTTGLFGIAAIVSTAISSEIVVSLGILKGWIFIPMFFAWAVYSFPNAHKLVQNALISSGTVMALLGISQIGILDRIRGVYDVPNSLALFLVPIAILALYLGVHGESRKKFYLVAVLIMTVAIVFTHSLAGVLCLVMISGYLLFRSRQSYVRSWVLGVAVVSTLLAGSIVFGKAAYLVAPGSSAYVRLQLWSVGADLIKDHPVLGIGLGQFEPAYQVKLHERFAHPANYALSPLPEFVFRDPHNWVIAFWLNIGIFGLVSFFVLHVFVLKKNHPWNGPQWALVALLLFGLVDTIYWKNDLAALHWTLLLLSMKTRPS